jgi:hypothetical protein
MRCWKCATRHWLRTSERCVLAVVFSTRRTLLRAMRKLQIVSELARRSKHGQSVADLHYRAKLHSLSSGPFWSADMCIQHARLVRLLPPLSGTRMERADMASIKVLQRQLDVFKYRLLLRVMQLWKVGVRSLTGSAASAIGCHRCSFCGCMFSLTLRRSDRWFVRMLSIVASQTVAS